MAALLTSFIIFITIINVSLQDEDTVQGTDSNGCEERDPKLVRVAQGVMRGSTMYSGKRKPFCSFRRIPFSQPPVGEYRFQAPREPVPWTGILDATEDNPECMQFNPVIGSIGYEDCLYLSVFTPRLNNSSNRLLDVMVWIFPGEYCVGTSSSLATGPNYLIDKDVIVVYLNYRLGVLGFLSTGDDEAPGNYGMKDQVAGLRWVKNNIAAFGGNTSSITIFGTSAGSSSCHLQMLSPLSKGFFHKVISMSGTAVNPWSRCPFPMEVAKKQASIVHCPTDSSSNLVNCLRKMNPRKLVASLKYMYEWTVFPGTGFAPVVEKKTQRNPDPFMTEDPLEVIRKGSFERVPWLMGGTNQELAIGIPLFINVIAARYQINHLIRHGYLSKLLSMEVSVPPDKAVEIANKIADFYMGSNHEFNHENCEHLIRMYSDRLLIHGQHKAAQLHALAGNQTIYKYNAAYRGLYSSSMSSDIRNYGTSHGDMMVYIFKLAEGILLLEPLDQEVRDTFITFLTNFAKYGNPTPGIPSGNYLVDEFEWLPIANYSFDSMHLRYLNIGQVKYPGIPSEYLNEGLGPVTLQMAEDLYKDRMDFMDSLPLAENCFKDCRTWESNEFHEDENETTSSFDTETVELLRFVSQFVLVLSILTVMKLVRIVVRYCRSQDEPGYKKMAAMPIQEASCPPTKDLDKKHVDILISDNLVSIFSCSKEKKAGIPRCQEVV